ncbi:MAG: hypothetical protein ACRCUH_15350 [Shewanella sp.]
MKETIEQKAARFASMAKTAKPVPKVLTKPFNSTIEQFGERKSGYLMRLLDQVDKDMLKKRILSKNQSISDKD